MKRAALLAALLAVALWAPAAHASFGVSSFSATVLKSDLTTSETQAGAHPYVGITDFTLSGTENARDIRVDLPPGLISNPQAADTCSDAQFPSSCPASSQIGVEEITVLALLVTTTYKTPIYNMQTDADHVSDFAFSIPAVAQRTDILGGVRDTSDFGLFFTIAVATDPSPLMIERSKLTFWGVPSDASHDAERGQSCTINLGIPVCLGGGTAVARTNKPFLSLPTACSGPQTTTLSVTSFANSTAMASDVTKVNGVPTGATGCENVPFNPSITVTPDSTQADEPGQTTVDLHVPQSYDDASKLATAHVKDVSVTLPDGMTINPAAATGLAGCSDPAACPPASKIGTVEIDTPVLPGPLTGSVHLGQPLPDDPYRLFVEARGFGLTVRLAGSVHPDPQTGRLTATFTDTPQVPFEHFILTFAGGPTATLATPLKCGTATTTSALTPYSGQSAATPTSAFTVDADGKGGACPPTPFNLGFAAGTQDTRAAAFSPFRVDVTRDDRQNLLSKLSVRQPPGMLGVLSSVPLCADPAAATGTCPDSSRIGTASVRSGAGPQPFALSGPVYLTGPYAGAPFGLSIAIRAVAGPFDLGTVVVRAAIHVDPADSHLTIDADPLPQILQGIPLRLREVSVLIDRGGFIFNPSSCAPLAIHGTLTAVDGTVEEVDAPFQATGCGDLPFSPTLEAVADGRTSAAAGAGLKVTLRQPAGQANVHSVSVQLPKQFTARGTTVAGACPEATFATNLAGCPNARVGSVHAETPLLSGPLDGPVYLVAHSSGLPTIEALMSRQGLNIDLSGTVTFGASGITSAFNAVPDVPITQFVLDLPRGPHSALAAANGVCGGSLTMPTTIVGQNGATITRAIPVLVTNCGLKILRARVNKGKGTATLTIQVPRTGRLTVKGKRLRTARRSISKAPATVTVKVRLARRLRRHQRVRVHLTVRLGNLVARRTLTFR